MSWRHFGDNDRKPPVIRPGTDNVPTKKILRITPATYILYSSLCTNMCTFRSACSYMRTLLSLLAVEIVNLFLQATHQPTHPFTRLLSCLLMLFQEGDALMRKLTIVMLLMMMMRRYLIAKLDDLCHCYMDFCDDYLVGDDNLILANIDCSGHCRKVFRFSPDNWEVLDFFLKSKPHSKPFPVLCDAQGTLSSCFLPRQITQEQKDLPVLCWC